MAVEDFTTYTEVDPNSRVTVTATRITWAAIERDEITYVYKDKGVAFFGGDFTHYLTINTTAIGNGMVATHWAIANAIDTFEGIKGDGGSQLTLRVSGGASTIGVTIGEVDSGTGYGDDYILYTAGTVLYLKIVRDESVGTYGTIYCYIYSDADRTTLVDTLSVTLHTSKKDYRYIYAFQGAESTPGAPTASGYTENLELVYNATSTTAPSVTTQAATSVDKTTATGNGNVTSLGLPLATQYGHVWAQHPNPKTIESTTHVATGGKTELGVPSATGAFTSSLTALQQNKHYWMRAYITNSVGTFYGALVEFTTSPSTPVVVTELVTEIAATTALGNGRINNNGGSAVTQHGVTWNTGGSPNIDDDSKTEDGATDVIGGFFSLMTGLLASTTYKVRAYATNDAGTSYGDEITFVTFAVGAPIVTTERTSNVSGTSAQGEGTLVDIGGSAVTAHGHVWGTSPSPTTADSSKDNGAATAGAFTTPITGLGAATQYYIRAFATNTQGTAYGNNDIIREVAGELQGEITIIGEYAAYTSKSGKQRGLLGFEF